MHANIIGISSFQNWLNHPFRSTGFYFKRTLWKIVMKCKNVTFFSFPVIFLKMYTLRLWHFWGCDSNFAVVVRIYKIYDFDETFFFLLTGGMVTQNVTFLVSTETAVRKTNSFIKIMQLINPRYPWEKKRVKQRKPTQKNCCKDVYFFPLLRTKIPTIG